MAHNNGDIHLRVWSTQAKGPVIKVLKGSDICQGCGHTRALHSHRGCNGAPKMPTTVYEHTGRVSWVVCGCVVAPKDIRPAGQPEAPTL